MAAKKIAIERPKIQHLQLINHIGNLKIDYCIGCNRFDSCFICTIYQSPIDKCRIGCAFSPVAIASVQASLKMKDSKQRVGQQKQKKKK